HEGIPGDPPSLHTAVHHQRDLLPAGVAFCTYTRPGARRLAFNSARAPGRTACRLSPLAGQLRVTRITSPDVALARICRLRRQG
ncbi:MAG: hypothetical protein KC432_09185, partial [Thermomicrobiales bacterium]|nr:hypothetical protein [Thermomicrobiales bacterium]